VSRTRFAAVPLSLALFVPVFGQKPVPSTPSSPPPAVAQSPNPPQKRTFADDRYELGRRTREMERAWMATADPKLRQPAISKVQTAVIGFFGQNAPIVARELDETTALLREETLSPELLWAKSLMVNPESVVADTKRTAAILVVRPIYELSSARPAFTLLISVGKKTVSQTISATDKLPFSFPVELENTKEGEQVVGITVTTDGKTPLRSWNVQISRISTFETRVKALEANLTRMKKTVDAEPAKTEARRLAVASLETRLTLFQTVLAKKQPETDFPLTEMVRDAERLYTLSVKFPPSLLQPATGEIFRTAPNEKGGIPTRSVANPEATVLVVAFHGAGGSENMFFDSYGDGQIVKLCKERGWALLCPRVTSPLDDYLSAIDRLKPIVAPKATKVFIVGHSLGAVTSLTVALKAPERFAAVAPISGRAASDVKPLSQTPMFVAAGTKDFSRPGSTQLGDRLKALGAPVTFKLYEAEHLLVVPDALPDIFKWLDGLAK
jgi:predicted esterase